MRSFTGSDVIILPRLDADEAHALGVAVIAAGDAKSLSPGAAEAREEIILALSALGAALMVRKLPPDPSEPQLTKRDVDDRVDSGWSGTYSWLTGWMKLGHLAESKIAKDLCDRLFPDGVKFVQATYPHEWAECERRLALISEAKLEPSFAALGGAAIVTELRDAHRAYGEVLGLTKAPPEKEKQARIRECLDELTAALRAYIVQVMAMARKSDPVSSALAEKLLRPIVEWKTRPIKHTGVSPEAPVQGSAP